MEANMVVFWRAPCRGVRRHAGAALAVLATVVSVPARPAAQRVVQGTVACAGVRDCAGAVVWVDASSDRTPVPGREAVIDQRQLTFVPHVLVVVQGTTVVFKNSDDAGHNVFSVSPVKRFNLGTYPKGVDKRLVFDRPGIVELLCNVHPEMSAFIVVTATASSATVGPDGRYELGGVPDGAFTLAAWREGLTIQRRQVPATGEPATIVNFALSR
jgi:plastocyanin